MSKKESQPRNDIVRPVYLEEEQIKPSRKHTRKRDNKETVDQYIHRRNKEERWQ